MTLSSVTFDPATTVAAVVALITALDARRRTRGNKREMREMRSQVQTLRRHLRIVLAALQEAERELASRNPMIRSEETRRHAPPH